MNSEGTNSFYLLAWKEQTLKGHSWLYFFLLHQVTWRLESMKPARIPASSSLWAISFLLRIYCLIYQMGGITDPVGRSQGQYIKGHKCVETYGAPDKGILQLSPPLAVWHSFNRLDNISSNLHQPTRPQRTGRGVIKSD